MTVKINSLRQVLTTGGVAFSSGILEFSNYSKDGETSTNLNYEGYGATAVTMLNAGINSNGFASGYIDIINRVPVFKINSFTPTSLPIVVAEEELATTFS